MKSVCLAVLAVIVAAQPTVESQVLNPSAREILNTARTLLPAEIAVVLGAVRDAVAGKTLRLTYVPNGPGPEVLMGNNGRPRFVRAVSGHFDPNGHVDVVAFTDYTGQSATTCEGTSLSEELVIEYEHKSTEGRWTAKARRRERIEPLAPVFELLTGRVSVESGSRRSFEDRVGRALVAPWKPPDGAQTAEPIPRGATQSLWIDVASLLPLRWSISIPAMPGRGLFPEYGLSFTYDSSLDLRPPDIKLPSDCVR